MLNQKLQKLKKILKGYRSVLVAFSGGVDSTFLLKVALDVLGPQNVLAVIASSETYPKEECQTAKKIAKKLGAHYLEIKTDEFKDQRFISNPPERCFFCKMELFSKLKKVAKENRLKIVADGSNVDDWSDFRPGSRAKKKLGIKSPLQGAGFTKNDIRKLSKKLGLPTWNKPSMACLASRIPYGQKITPVILKRVGEAERFLRGFKLGQLRVRHHGPTARIELEKKALQRVVKKGLLECIVRKFKKLGYKYVTLDLEGYRTGSMNAVLPNQS
ncbi:MAG: ATP-dependent sacrificial sulfur transferase LarE [Candidatus Saganbacteria bacterium]|nr:ATP-dependent sacrificial sulfur transferase LarE [Candidatus Saganbacteria bacterium]